MPKEDLVILRPKDIMDITGLSRETINRMEKRGDFPPKIQLSKRSIGWLETDVKKWFKEKKTKF